MNVEVPKKQTESHISELVYIDGGLLPAKLKHMLQHGFIYIKMCRGDEHTRNEKYWRLQVGGGLLSTQNRGEIRKTWLKP